MCNKSEDRFVTSEDLNTIVLLRFVGIIVVNAKLETIFFHVNITNTFSVYFNKIVEKAK